MVDRRIVTLSYRGFPGADRALVELSRSTRLTRHVRLASSLPGSVETGFVSAWLREQRPPLVLFGAWSPLYMEVMTALRGTGISFGVYWTSSGGQTDMSAEAAKLAQVLSEPAIDMLLFCHAGVAEGLRGCGKPVYYVPLTLVEPETLAQPDDGEEKATRISLFCPPAEYRRKNILNCLMALAQVTERFHLLVNGLSEQPDYRLLMDALHLPYIDLGWMERSVYERQLQTIHLGLQLSFAESYNYVAADHLLRGIPVLASAMVPVMDLLQPETRDALVIERADDVGAIRDRLRTLVGSPGLRRDLGMQAQGELLAANRRCIAEASSVLRRLAI